MSKKLIIRNEKRGCLWWCGVFVLACFAIALVIYAACIAAGIGLWFLIRYCWRKLVEQAPDSKFVERASSVPPIVRQVAAGFVCALVSIALLGSVASTSNNTTTQKVETQQVSKQEDKTTDKASSSAKKKKKASTKAETTDDSSTASTANLVVKFLDVGQGDACLIEFPDGKTMLVDTPTGASSTVTSALAKDKRESIDWLVATHPDADHIGGLAQIISSTKVGTIWAPNASSTTQTYTTFLESIQNKDLSIETAYAGRQIASGDNYTVDILWPQQDASYGEDNAYSVIVKVTYGENTFLLTGDAPVEAQDQCIDGHVDVLKVSHHGSASGLNNALAAKLTPSIAVISYGENSYGHPTQVVLDALSSVNAKTYGTYVNGTITVTSDGHDVKVKPECEGTIAAASQDAGASSQGLGTAGGGGGSSGQSTNEAVTTQDTQTTTQESQASNSTGGDETVVITPSGSKYHRSGCRTLSRSKSLTETTKSQAAAQGYSPCAVCNP